MRIWYYASAVIAGLVTGGTLTGTAQVVTRQAEGYLPQVTLVRANVSDAAQICAEVEGTDRVNCRSIGELRKWLRERPMKEDR